PVADTRQLRRDRLKRRIGTGEGLRIVEGGDDTHGNLLPPFGQAGVCLRQQERGGKQREHHCDTARSSDIQITVVCRGSCKTAPLRVPKSTSSICGELSAISAASSLRQGRKRTAAAMQAATARPPAAAKARRCVHHISRPHTAA